MSHGTRHLERGKVRVACDSGVYDLPPSQIGAAAAEASKATDQGAFEVKFSHVLAGRESLPEGCANTSSVIAVIPARDSVWAGQHGK